MRTIIGDDLNSIAKPDLNSYSKNRKQVTRPLHKILEQHAFFDTFRTLHPKKTEFTYKRSIQQMTETTQSRLDYIYTD